MAAYDKNGSELKAGDKVVLHAVIQEVVRDNVVLINPGNIAWNSAMLEKEEESDVQAAAKEGFYGKEVKSTYKQEKQEQK